MTNHPQFDVGFEHGLDVLDTIIAPALARGKSAAVMHDPRVPRPAAYFRGFEAALESAGFVVLEGTILND